MIERKMRARLSSASSVASLRPATGAGSVSCLTLALSAGRVHSRHQPPARSRRY